MYVCMYVCIYACIHVCLYGRAYVKVDKNACNALCLNEF